MTNFSRPGVLILIKGLGLGGAERLLVDALPYLDRQRFRYEFAYVLPWKDHLVPVLLEAGFPVHALRGQNPLSPAVVMRLMRLVRERNIQLIHAHLPLTGVLARIVGHWLGIPVVYTEHNVWDRYHPVTRRLNSWSFRWNRYVFAVSKAVKRSMNPLQASVPVKVLENGVPLENLLHAREKGRRLRKELGIQEEEVVVGNVCVFRHQKRLDLWIRAAAHLSRKHPRVRFLLVGHGPEEKHLRKEILRLGMRDRILMPGFQLNGRVWMGVMDIYLLTSAYEGLPMALLEAMGMGIPVVSSAVGGIPEVVTPGETGFLFPFEEMERDPENVIEKMMDPLIRNPELRNRIGDQAQKKIRQRYHTRDRVRATESVYAQILDGRW